MEIFYVKFIKLLDSLVIEIYLSVIIYSSGRPAQRMFGITSALSVEGPTEKDKVMTEDLQSILAFFNPL